MNKATHSLRSTTSASSLTNSVIIKHGECIQFIYVLQDDGKNFDFTFAWSSEFIPVVGMGKVKTSWRTKGKRSPDEFCLS